MHPDILQLPLPMPEHELTGLPNREALQSIVEHYTYTRPGQFRLYELDLDQFKHINDVYGHPEGDAYLVNVADILGSLVRRRPAENGEMRQLDIIGYGLASHVSGDEFWLLLDEVDEEKAAEIIARVQNTLEDHGIGASIGGRLHRPGETAEALFADADRLMYVAKRGRLRERYDARQIAAVRGIGRTATEFEIDPRDIPALLDMLAAEDEEDV